MKNKFLIIFLGIIVSLFFTNKCFADPLPAPYNLEVGAVGQASANLIWYHDTDPESGDISRFRFLYKEPSDKEDKEVLVTLEDVEASGDSYVYTLNLRGLNSGTEYEWGVTAEAPDPRDYSVEVQADENFTTEPEQWEEEPNGGGGEPQFITNPFEDIGNVQEAADAFMEFAILTGFAVGPILIIYAAFLLLTKQGNPEAITQAKKIILWTIVALSIMLFAKGIPAVIKDIFK